MTNHLVGVLVIAGIAFLAATHSKPAPSIKGTNEATQQFPRLHWYQGADDVDRTLEIEVPREAPKNPDGSPGAPLPPLKLQLLEKGGRFYTRQGDPLATTTDDLYLVSPGIDLGTWAGARPSARGYDADVFGAGLRVSPVRLLYGTTAPDLVVSKDWAGAGFSFYGPERLVGPTWKHVGIGAWYGYPFGGLASGPPGWTVGASFTIR